ncbi:hypothetical protein [Nocardia amamiensis]|uniref:hypothetical protein n=1 Tax=Nocardia amamiensis TaxID=404578 RepID=UPI0012F47E06|nr:hypothetical protein [Nocardia amamiensis]
MFGDGEHGQEGVGEHRQDRPAPPRFPAPDLMLIEPTQAFAGLEVLLSRPLAPGDGDQAAQRPDVAS